MQGLSKGACTKGYANHQLKCTALLIHSVHSKLKSTKKCEFGEILGCTLLNVAKHDYVLHLDAHVCHLIGGMGLAFIKYPSIHILLGSLVNWSLSQLLAGERWGTPWTSRQPIARLIYCIG